MQLANDIKFGMAMQGLYVRAIMIDDTPETRDNLSTYSKFLDNKILELSNQATENELKNMLMKFQCIIIILTKL